jgi:hypothetical protein
MQVARDVMIIHMGAQSNLYAALAWTLVNVLLRPELLREDRGRRRRAARALRERVDPHGAELAHAAPGAAPIEVHDGVRTYRSAGTFLATMLSVNNTTAAPGLDVFDPDHYEAGAWWRASRSPRASS